VASCAPLPYSWGPMPTPPPHRPPKVVPCHALVLGVVLLAAGCMGQGAFAPGPSAYESMTMPPLEPGAGYRDEVPEGWAPGARIVVEGHVAVEVGDKDGAVAAVRRLAGPLGGHITRETIRPDAFMSVLVIRLPPERVEDLVSAVADLGPMRERSIERSDVAWQIRDAELRLENLRRTMARYQDLLEEATTVDEILRVEAELARVRTEIERIEAERAFLADRVALATLEVRLLRELVHEIEPEARLWPGLRATHLSLFTRGQRPRYFAGAGWSMMESRSFALEIDLFTRLGDSATRGEIGAAVATLGGGTYSELLGGGERRFLNPYLGYALGYGWVEGTSNFVGMLTVGVELFRSDRVLVDLGARWGVLAGPGGPSLMLEPALSAHLAF
jgi:hypothetical protein